jgi:diguanylate cyclase (GGDEF)-like protein
VLFSCQDVTERIRTEERIKFLAYYDRLTGLPNRTLFKEHLEKAISKSRRSGQYLSVLFIDIDNFRMINDTFGRETGDWILKKISLRIKDCLRRSDTAANVSQHDITARFGADEFGLILECLTDMADAAIVARRLIDYLTKVIVHEGNEIFLSCRIGLSVFPSDGETVVELMKTADSALSSAKELEKNSCQFYTADLNSKAFARFTLETSLRKAVERQQFVLMYQPQISLKSGEVTGVEALIRWVHPELGMIPPLEFIPLAEDSGLIIPIGEWVMTTAFCQCKQWQDMGYTIKTAINLSAAQFKSQGLIDSIKRVIAQSQVDPNLIEFEITESMLMNDAEGSIVLLEELSKLGATISIDDFGTGYSSLNYLKRFPVDVLKVDRSFVSDLANNEDDASIVKAIVTLAHNLDLEVVAEGVEEKEQLAYLKQLGCDIFQGYFVSKPVASDEVEAFFPGWNLSSLCP